MFSSSTRERDSAAFASCVCKYAQVSLIRIQSLALPWESDANGPQSAWATSLPLGSGWCLRGLTGSRWLRLATVNDFNTCCQSEQDTLTDPIYMAQRYLKKVVSEHVTCPRSKPRKLSLGELVLGCESSLGVFHSCRQNQCRSGKRVTTGMVHKWNWQRGERKRFGNLSIAFQDQDPRPLFLLHHREHPSVSMFEISVGQSSGIAVWSMLLRQWHIRQLYEIEGECLAHFSTSCICPLSRKVDHCIICHPVVVQAFVQLSLFHNPTLV